MEFYETYELWASFFIFFCFGFIVSVLEFGRSVHDDYDPKAFRHGALLIFLFVFVMGMTICGGLAYDAFQANLAFEVEGSHETR